MRQSDGADLLGSNNPHSADIGIIYVAPDDTRQSVLTAILTQERLHRKQIALVLPDRNNAFGRPVDFDGLKDMRRDLQAQLVVIAPHGSSPSELARHRRFSVYSSLETFAQSLHDEEQAPGAPRKGHVFGRRPKATQTDTAASTPSNLSEEETQPPLPVVDAAPAVPPPTAHNESEVQEVPQAATDNADDDEDKEIEFPLVTPPAHVEHDVTQPSNIPAQAEEEPVVVSTGSPADGGDAEDDEEKIILIPPPPRVKPASNYPVPVGASAPGVVPPANANYPSVYVPSQRRRRRWWIAIPIVLLLLVIGFFVYRPLLDLIFVPQATITITPVSKELKHTYTLTAVIGTPDAALPQVQARLLYAASGTVQESVNASGTAHIPAVQAVGTLNFYNSSPTPQTVPAGTVFVSNSGVQVVNDDTVTVPAGTPPSEGIATDTAHAVNGGSKGNIAALDLSTVSCCSTPGIIVRNETAFTGGQDAQTYTYVEQSDIDNAASVLATKLTANTQGMLMKQVQKGEQLVQPPQCTPTVTSDQSAGDHSSTVTVGARVICTGEVYDQHSVYARAANLLATDSTLNPGVNFMPVGHIVATIQQARMGENNTITLQVLTGGIWVYQFDANQIHRLRNLIAGKSQDDALSLLKQQYGVDKTSIQLYWGNGTTLPSDFNHITLDVLNVPGLPANAVP
jgi:hypothetical protein